MVSRRITPDDVVRAIARRNQRKTYAMADPDTYSGSGGESSTFNNPMDSPGQMISGGVGGTPKVIAEATVQGKVLATGPGPDFQPVWGWHLLDFSGILDFPSIAANSQSELSVTVTGAVTGARVVLGPPATIEAGLIGMAYVSAANTVTVRLVNFTGSAIDPASATWKLTVIQ